MGLPKHRLLCWGCTKTGVCPFDNALKAVASGHQCLYVCVSCAIAVCCTYLHARHSHCRLQLFAELVGCGHKRHALWGVMCDVHVIHMG
jgi:hypothetical protein